MPAEVETMFYTSEGGVPWHRLGTQTRGLQTSADAIVAAGLAWEVRKSKIYAGDTAKTARIVSDKAAVIREDTGACLGIVTPAYEPLQNAEAFDFMDSLLADGVLHYETAGALSGGKQIWVLARMDDDLRINGEEWHPYLLLATRHDGRGAVRVLPTTVRVVCQNTLQMALGSGRRAPGISVVHSRSMKQRLEDAQRVMALTTAAQRRLRALMEAAAEVAVTEDDVVTVQTALFGSLDESTRATRRRAIETFQAIYAAESQLNGSNAYSLLNSITGYVDHSRKYQGSSEERNERRFESVLEPWGTGYQMKERGFRALVTASPALAALMEAEA